MHAVTHTADTQDRDVGPLVLFEIINRFPRPGHVFADGGYAGEKLHQELLEISKWTIELDKWSDTTKGLKVLLCRLVDERTFA